MGKGMRGVGAAVDKGGVGARLRRIRFLLNKRQMDMAKLLNISNSHYSKLEIGIGGVSYGLLYAVSNIFGVSYDWLCEGSGPGPRSADDLHVTEPIPPHSHSLLEDEAVIEDIIRASGREDLRVLAQQLARTLHIDFEHALAMLVRETVLRDREPVPVKSSRRPGDLMRLCKKPAGEEGEECEDEEDEDDEGEDEAREGRLPEPAGERYEDEELELEGQEEPAEDDELEELEELVEDDLDDYDEEDDTKGKGRA